MSKAQRTKPQASETNPPHLLDVVDPKVLSSATGIEVDTLAHWRSQRVGPPYIKAGRKVLYSVAAVNEWLQQNMRATTGGTISTNAA